MDQDLVDNSNLVTLTATTTDSPTIKFVGVVPMIMNILNTVLGAGILSVSNSFTFCGLIPSVLMLCASAIFTYISTIMVIKMAAITNSDSLGYLAMKTVGKYGSLLLSISLLCFCYACMTAYLIMSTEIIQGWLLLAGVNTNTFAKRSLVCVCYSLFLPIMLTVPKHVGFLNYASTFCFFSLIAYVAGMIYKAIILLPKQGIDPTVETSSFGIKIFNSLGIYSLSFALAGVIIPIIRNMQPNLHKRYVATGSAFFLSFVITLVPGMLGYLIFGRSAKPLILSNFPDDDIIFIIVRVACCIVLTASYPALGVTILAVYSRVFYKTENHAALAWKHRIVVLICQNILPLAIAIFLPNVRPAMGIGGAFGAGTSNLVLPPLMWVIFNEKKWTHWTNLLSLLMFVVGTAAAGIATYEAVLDCIAAFSGNNN
ncbi:Transmembrane amino acid transporter protein [Trichomonas vaginalis G3]|uniref:Transmembrane amino acid transporter protein n=1 Tax=Trichomonas vaginalis (strain ATCC PRA-98 / G3) TaxID=412133 RepID=A2EQ35_TRIV3|nr:amino acid transmembrane transporter protein [Trichomonas vaginalis G3]EAY05210.1 Transmembrane amino acid transporter protein [Trichomonas vaginalis G3]KAI5542623.1 amino acid transmembrane transporter protein [Trichomonas vaginalis G3]|eukprot:XP_001317433.1 Transmembrane amino acid transporter protein [Trichomonas vaginalis G3]